MNKFTRCINLTWKCTIDRTKLILLYIRVQVVHHRMSNIMDNVRNSID